MKSIIFNILFLNILFFIAFTSAVFRSNETDHSALMSVKAELSYDSLQSWNQSTHFCRWTGITCGRKHMRVIELDLSAQQLSGKLSPFIGNLSFLRNLILNDNNLTGKIPPEISKLPRLRIIRLSNNLFFGEIPSNISKCLNLEELDFGDNQLVGTIPFEFHSLSNLKLMILRRNNLTGQIPDYLGNFSALTQLYLTSNSFEGNIPSAIGKLSSLEDFSVSLNYLTGELPPALFNLSNLATINMVYNKIEGSLPSDFFFKFPSLEVMNIGGNRFTGVIPNSLSNASNLWYLDISTNGFTGKIPDLNNLQSLVIFDIYENLLGNAEEGDMNFISSISNYSVVQRLALYDNNFGGTFPRSLGNLSELTEFYFLDNPMLYCEIPNDIGNLVKLEAIDLGDNFSGKIPSSIGNLRELRILNLDQNDLSGHIPPSLGNLTNLINLFLSENSFEGSIPTTLTACNNLLVFDLSRNNLSGEIPPYVLSLPSLTSLDLSKNRLSGSLVLEQQVSLSLYEFLVADNLLSGEIPSFLGLYQSLNYLSLAGNFFHGVIPSSFRSLRGLEVLNLSLNNLSGGIPEFLETSPYLQSLDLSFNDFESVVPEGGVFSNASNVSILGNDKLCGGVQELNLPECAIEMNPRVHNLPKYIIPVCISAVILVLMIILAFVLYKKRYARKVFPSIDLVIDTFPQVTYRDLHKATNGFSQANLCGSGKFSDVYEGVLDHSDNMTNVAIKVLKLDVSGATRSFTAECEALRSIRHRNLLKIVTSCSTIDFQGFDFKALVYEFMVNGSLENQLHHNPASISLTLLERLNIVIDVACALDYLHNETETSMVHCDVKPSNVLLDEDLVAHLGDFGLLKFMREAVSTVHSSNSLAVRGTVGYAAPEYGMGSNITTYGDVYSFGILVLEVFSGKRPTDDMFTGGLDLHNFAKMEIFDPRLLPNEEQTNANSESGINATRECLISVYKVGIACSVEHPTERGNISNAVTKLHLIKKTYVDSSSPQVTFI